jgi:predicted ATPase/DNA-binding SARP family transcriptional activator
MPKRVALDSVQPLRIELLGHFRIAVGGRDVPEAAWRLRKGQSLVKLLALAPGHRLHREQLEEALWPGFLPAAAANNLYRALHFARRAIDPAAAARAHYLSLHDEVVALGPAGALWIDAEAFEAAAAAAHGRQDPLALRAALDLYAGDLLPDDRFADWTERQREVLRAEYLALLTELAALHEARGEYAAAIAVLDRVVVQEPAHEAAHTALMRSYARAGHRHRALRQYQQLADAMREALDAEPDPATERLYREIRAGRFATDRPSPPVPQRVRDNLPSALTSFVGREREIATVRRLLAETRLLTLIGPGGCGKTRLALRAAADLLDAPSAEAAPRFPHGVWLVELAALADPGFVPQAVARALGVLEIPGQSLTDTLAAYLRDKQLLLVLDNCEHLVAACAALSARLLQACPAPRLLATSREALGCAGETVWRVPPLILPDPRRPLTTECLAAYEAVRLFVERTRGGEPDFALTDENAAAVAEVCRRLDGLPLAIELAAARVGLVGVAGLAAHLDDRFRLLTRSHRGAPPRQQTLRAAIDWSYDLLAEPERALWRRLAVFAGGFTLEAAEAVCIGASIGVADVLTLLAALVDKSLVNVEERGGETRYGLLETIRQYGEEKLQAAGEVVGLRARHCDWYAALAEEGERGLRGPQSEAWMQRLERELPNLRAALDWSHAQPDGAEAELWLFAGLGQFFCIRGYFNEGRERGAAALARLHEASPIAASRACIVEALSAWIRGEFPRARACLERGLPLARAVGDLWWLAAAIGGLGVVAADEGDFDRAVAACEEALVRLRELGDDWGIAWVHCGLARVARERGDYARAAALYEEALTHARVVANGATIAYTLQHLGLTQQLRGNYARATAAYGEALTIWRRLNSQQGIAQSLTHLGMLARLEGDLVRAAAIGEQALALWRELGARLFMAPVLHLLGAVAHEQGDDTCAAARFAESLAICQETNHRPGVAQSLDGLAAVASARGEPERAARLLGAAAALREAIGLTPPPAERAEHERTLDAVRAAIDPRAFAIAWAAGRALPIEQTVDEALAITAPGTGLETRLK